MPLHSWTINTYVCIYTHLHTYQSRYACTYVKCLLAAWFVGLRVWRFVAYEVCLAACRRLSKGLWLRAWLKRLHTRMYVCLCTLLLLSWWRLPFFNLFRWQVHWDTIEWYTYVQVCGFVFVCPKPPVTYSAPPKLTQAIQLLWIFHSRAALPSRRLSAFENLADYLYLSMHECIMHSITALRQPSRWIMRAFHYLKREMKTRTATKDKEL